MSETDADGTESNSGQFESIVGRLRPYGPQLCLFCVLMWLTVGAVSLSQLMLYADGLPLLEMGHGPQLSMWDAAVGTVFSGGMAAWFLYLYDGVGE